MSNANKGTLLRQTHNIILRILYKQPSGNYVYVLYIQKYNKSHTVTLLGKEDMWLALQ